MTYEHKARKLEPTSRHEYWRRCSVALMPWVMIVLLTGCGGPRLETVDDVVAALEKEGIQYTATSPANTSKLRRVKIDEAIVVTGDTLNVEILRIEREKHFKIFAGMGVLLAAVEVQAGKTFADKPGLYARRPFIVIIRQEPREGQVRAALKRIFPPSDAKR